MDARSFFFGIVVGGVAVAAITWLDDDNGEESATAPPASEITPIHETADRGPADDTADESDDVETQEPVAQHTRTLEPIRNPPGAWDTQFYLDRRWDEINAERKDEAWAYSMEQAIRQFLTEHAQIGEFDINYIECRTKTCQIQVIGFDRSASPTWNRITFDFMEQYGNTFYSSGGTGYELDGRPVIVHKLIREVEDPQN